jgi:DNA-binding GntR family transcriptional regulator
MQPNGKYAEAYRRIYERILRGEFGPGYRLSIDALAREFGMSPTPVREALRRLQAEGVVTYERYRGARVAQVDERAYTETLSLLALLEGYATALAAPRLQPGTLRELRRMNERMRQAMASFDLPLFDRLNRRFHMTLCAGCDHRYLLDLLRATWNRMDTIRRSIFPFIPHRGLDSVKEHDRLIELIEQGADPVQIERFARQHKLRTLEAYLRWKRQVDSEERGLGKEWEAPVEAGEGAR